MDIVPKAQNVLDFGREHLGQQGKASEIDGAVLGDLKGAPSCPAPSTDSASSPSGANIEKRGPTEEGGQMCELSRGVFGSCFKDSQLERTFRQWCAQRHVKMDVIYLSGNVLALGFLLIWKGDTCFSHSVPHQQSTFFGMGHAQLFCSCQMMMAVALILAVACKRSWYLKHRNLLLFARDILVSRLRGAVWLPCLLYLPLSAEASLRGCIIVYAILQVFELLVLRLPLSWHVAVHAHRLSVWMAALPRICGWPSLLENCSVLQKSFLLVIAGVIPCVFGFIQSAADREHFIESLPSDSRGCTAKVEGIHRDFGASSTCSEGEQGVRGEQPVGYKQQASAGPSTSSAGLSGVHTSCRKPSDAEPLPHDFEIEAEDEISVDPAGRAEAAARPDDDSWQWWTEVVEIVKSYFCRAFSQICPQESPAERAFQDWFAEQQIKFDRLFFGWYVLIGVLVLVSRGRNSMFSAWNAANTLAPLWPWSCLGTLTTVSLMSHYKRQWYCRHRSKLVSIFSLANCIFAGHLTVPYILGPSPALRASMQFVFSVLPGILAIESCMTRLPFAWSVGVLFIRTAIILANIFPVCSHAVSPSACKLKTVPFNLLCGFFVPVLAAAFLERAERQRWLQDSGEASEPVAAASTPHTNNSTLVPPPGTRGTLFPPPGTSGVSWAFTGSSRSTTIRRDGVAGAWGSGNMEASAVWRFLRIPGFYFESDRIERRFQTWFAREQILADEGFQLMYFLMVLSTTLRRARGGPLAKLWFEYSGLGEWWPVWHAAPSSVILLLINFKSDWYCRHRTAIMVLRFISVTAFSGMFPLPHDAMVLAALRAQLQMFVYVLPGINCFQGLILRLPVHWHIVLQIVRPCYILVALPRVCQHAASPQLCLGKGGILNLIAGALIPIICNAYLERRDRLRFMESRPPQRGPLRARLVQPGFDTLGMSSGRDAPFGQGRVPQGARSRHGTSRASRSGNIGPQPAGT
eukprot:jgi/Botrbrau1/20885/Bobra.0135s0016.1